MSRPDGNHDFWSLLIETFLRDLTRHTYDSAVEILFYLPTYADRRGPSWESELRLLAWPSYLQPLLHQIVASFVRRTLFFLLGSLQAGDLVENKYRFRVWASDPIASFHDATEVVPIELDLAHAWLQRARTATDFRGAMDEHFTGKGDYPNSLVSCTPPLLYHVSRPIVPAEREVHPLTVMACLPKPLDPIVGWLSILSPLRYRAHSVLLPKPRERFLRPRFHVPPAVIAAGVRLRPGQQVWVDAWGRKLGREKPPVILPDDGGRLYADGIPRGT